MRRPHKDIPDVTLEAFARGFFREASCYGFKAADYIRFVNRLLDVAIVNDDSSNTPHDFHRAQSTEELQTSHDRCVDKLPLIGHRVVLRQFEPRNDLGLVRRWLCDPQGRHFALSSSTPVLPDPSRLFARPDTRAAMVTLTDDEPIGVLAYLNHDVIQHKAELRKLIGPPAMRGKGLGKEATQLWLAYGRSGLELKKIYLNTLDTNTRNVRLNESLGFQVEGILRNEVLLDGKYRDVLRMGLCFD